MKSTKATTVHEGHEEEFVLFRGPSCPSWTIVPFVQNCFYPTSTANGMPSGGSAANPTTPDQDFDVRRASIC